MRGLLPTWKKLIPTRLDLHALRAPLNIRMMSDQGTFNREIIDEKEIGPISESVRPLTRDEMIRNLIWGVVHICRSPGRENVQHTN